MLAVEFSKKYIDKYGSQVGSVKRTMWILRPNRHVVRFTHPT